MDMLKITFCVWAASSIPAAILAGTVGALWLVVKMCEICIALRCWVRNFFGKDKS